MCPFVNFSGVSPGNVKLTRSKRLVLRGAQRDGRSRTVKVSFAGYNNHPAPEREDVASTVAALLAKEAEKNPAFERVVSLHVEYVKHGLWFAKTVDIIEIRRGADGTFKRHQT